MDSRFRGNDTLLKIKFPMYSDPGLSKWKGYGIGQMGIGEIDGYFQ